MRCPKGCYQDRGLSRGCHCVEVGVGQGVLNCFSDLRLITSEISSLNFTLLSHGYPSSCHVYTSYKVSQQRFLCLHRFFYRPISFSTIYLPQLRQNVVASVDIYPTGGFSVLRFTSRKWSFRTSSKEESWTIRRELYVPFAADSICLNMVRLELINSSSRTTRYFHLHPHPCSI